MLYSDDRNTMRQVFFDAWDKAKCGKVLTPLESQIVDVINHHPEYHAMLEGREAVPIEVEPFLHLGLHLAIRDQLHLDRPVGIKKIFEQLSELGWTGLEIEHRMMGCLSEVLWEAQEKQQSVDEQRYYALLLGLVNK
jgi:hypothetical protein